MATMGAQCHCDVPDGFKPPKRGTLARAVEQRELKRREQESVRKEMDKFYAEQRAHNQGAGDPLRDDIKRMERQQKERTQEAQMLDSMYQAERTHELALLKAEEEERLATVLARRQYLADRKEREVQQLREGSEELKELAIKIRAARVNRDRAIQQQQNAEIKARQAEYDAAFNEYVQQSEAAATAQEAQAQAYRRAQACKAREVLEEQMLERQDLLKHAEEQAARERAMVDQVVARIRAEDAADAALRAQKVQETKAFIAGFLEQQEVARKAKLAADAAEEQKRQDHWARIREREAEEAARKAARKEEADRMYEKVRNDMEAARARQEEEEDLINLLRQEEEEARRRAAEEARKAKREAMMREIQQANEHQMRLRAEREVQRKADEEAFKASMMARFAEEDRLEQMNAQKRRMKQLEHAREVQRMVDERRAMYQEQKAREEAEIAALAAEEARKEQILEGERRKLLAEAAELKDYLPRGVLRDQADVDFINSLLAGASLGGQ